MKSLLLALLLSANAFAVGGAPIKFVRNVYGTTNVITTAYTTLVASISSPIANALIVDSSTRAIVLSFASTCAALSQSVNSILIPPGGFTSFIPLDIPMGNCIGIEALSGSATAGELDLTLLR